MQVLAPIKMEMKMPYELAPSNAAKVERAIERISTACGELQTSGLPFAVVQAPVMGLMQILGNVQELRKDITVKDKCGRGRKPGEIEGSEVLTPDELSKLELEAGVIPNTLEQTGVTMLSAGGQDGTN